MLSIGGDPKDERTKRIMLFIHTCAVSLVLMLAYFAHSIGAYRELNLLNLHQIFETIPVLSIDFCQYFQAIDKYYRLQMDIDRS